jgi:hypothetical protein
MEPQPKDDKFGSGTVPDTGVRIPDSKPDWRKRLSSLDMDKQKKIALKYYGGHMPWKE